MKNYEGILNLSFNWDRMASSAVFKMKLHVNKRLLTKELEKLSAQTRLSEKHRLNFYSECKF